MKYISNYTARRFIFGGLAAVMMVSSTACGKKENNEEVEIEESSEVVFFDGISIGGVDISGLDANEAKELLNRELNNDKKIVIKIGEKEYEIGFEKIDAFADFESGLIEALDIIDADESEIEAIKAEIATDPVDFKISYSYNEELLIQELEKIEEEIKKTDDKYEMNIEETVFRIEDMLESGSIVTMNADVNKKEENKLIGTFSTSFSANDVNRNENLRVACEKINGTVLKPGEIFDMNEALGPQDAKHGYKPAGVIENGKIVAAYGGGVCQVTTTIYNAAIFSELKIVERHNHSLMVGYVPLGRDAAVAGTVKNLRFQNDTDYPITIETYIENYNIVCNIYGHEIHDEGHRVDFERVWVKTIGKPAEKVTENPDMYTDERVVTYSGKTGAKVDTYKLVYEGDTLVSREWFSSSTYRATPDEVMVGTKQREAEVPQQEQPPVIGSEDINQFFPTEPEIQPPVQLPEEPVVPEVPVEPVKPEIPQPVVPEVPEVPVQPETPIQPDIPVIGTDNSSNMSDVVIGG